MNMLETLFRCENEKIKRALCYLIEIICEFSFEDDLLMKYSDKLSKIFETYLNDNEI